MDFVNEAVFYMVCIALVCFSGAVVDIEQSQTLGWIVIGVVASLLAFNVLVVFHYLSTFVRLLWIGYYHNS